MNHEEAIAIVARGFVWNAFEVWTEKGHEMLPDISEADYQRVVERAQLLLRLDAMDVTFERYSPAYKFLEARATDGEEASE